MYDLGARLKRIRQKRGLTQKELACRINKSVSAISSYESNAQLPPLDVLESIALTLNVSIDFLAGIEDYNTYSAKNLSPEQIELIDLLFEEFQCQRRNSGELTILQIKIIQRIFILFATKEMDTVSTSLIGGTYNYEK